MKKTLLSLFLLGSLLAASNLILNPTFEQGVSTPLPRDWHPSKGADFEMTEIDGKPALTLSKTGDKEQTPYWIQHNKTLQKGVEYQLSVLVKGETGIQGSIYAECNQPWKTFAKKFTCDGQWQRVVLSFRFKELNHAPYYVVRLSSLGKIAFTEPSLTEVDGQFHNGSFEQGESHWTLENATLPPRKEGGKSLKLDSRQKRSCAIQQGIRLRGGQVYRLSYSVCGGSDRQYTDSQGATWYRVAVLLKGKPLGNTGTWLDSFSSWQKKSVVFMAKGDYAVDIACEIKNPGMVFFDDLALEPLSSLRPPAPLRLLPPYNFHNARFSTQNTVDELRGVLQVNVEGAHHAVIIFRDGRQELPVSEGEHSFAFPVPVEEGCWPIVAEIFDQSGKSLATAKLDFNVYPKATGSHAVTFRQDGVMLLDGQPFFPICIWSVGGSIPYVERLRKAAKAGFNCAKVSDWGLEDAGEAGLMAILQVPSQLPQFEQSGKYEKWEKNYIARFKKILAHPSLIGYFNIDEPAWNGKPYAPIQEAYRFIARLDPYRPVFLNEAPRGLVEDLRPYAEACDVYGVDIYPVPAPNSHSDLKDKMMTSVGKYTDKCREVVHDGKPIWMTLQAFSWGELTKRPPGVFPSHEQSLFMALNAVAHGATGLFYWGLKWGQTDDDWSKLDILAKTIQELRAMTAVFVAENILQEVTTPTAGANLLHKRVDGSDIFIVLNETNECKAVQLQGKLPLQLHVQFENRTVKTDGAVFAEDFPPYTARVYTVAEKLPPPLPQPATRRFFTAHSFQCSDNFKKASWVWFPGQNRTAHSNAVFLHSFTVSEELETAELSVAADDLFRAEINGQKVLFGENYTCAATMDVRSALRVGENTLLVRARDSGQPPCGLLYALTLKTKSGKTALILSGENTKTALAEHLSEICPAQVLGKYGCSPWYNNVSAQYFDPTKFDSWD